MFDAEDRQDMLEAVGVLAELNGGQTFYVKPPFFPDSRLSMAGGDIDNVNPFCIATKEDVESLSITAGHNGSVITIEAKSFRALSFDPDSAGFVSIELGAV